MSFLGKKCYGKINEKYQSPPSEKTSTPFELLLLPKNQNSANSPPFLLISKKYYSSLCHSRHSSAATIDQLLKSPATYWIRSFTKSHCYKCYLLISAMEPNIINISISFHTRLNRNSTVTIHQKNIQILTTDSKTIKIFVHLYWMIFSTLRINHLETRINYQKPFSAYNIATCYTFPEKPLAVFKNKTKKWMTQKNSMKTLQKIYC